MLKLCHHLRKLRTTFLCRNSQAMLVISSVPDLGKVQSITLKPGCQNKFRRFILSLLIYSSSSQGKFTMSCELDHLGFLYGLADSAAKCSSEFITNSLCSFLLCICVTFYDFFPFSPLGLILNFVRFSLTHQ